MRVPGQGLLLLAPNTTPTTVADESVFVSKPIRHGEIISIGAEAPRWGRGLAGAGPPAPPAPPHRPAGGQGQGPVE